MGRHGQPIDQAAGMEVVRMREAQGSRRSEPVAPGPRPSASTGVRADNVGTAGAERDRHPAGSRPVASASVSACNNSSTPLRIMSMSSSARIASGSSRTSDRVTTRRDVDVRRLETTHKQKVMTYNQELTLLRDHGSLGCDSVIQDKCQTETGPRSGFSGGEPRGTEQRE